MFRRLVLPALILVALLVLSLPWVLKHALLTNLRAQGYTASIGSLQIFPGYLALRDLRVGRDGEDLTHIQNLQVRYRLGGLLQGRLAARELIVDGALVTLREAPPGTWQALGVPGMNVVEGSAEETASTAPQAGIERIDLRDSRIRLIRPHGTTEAHVALAYVGPLATWDAARPTPFALRVAGGFGRLDVTGEVTPLTVPGTLAAHVDWRDAALGTLARLADGELPPPLTALAGDATLDARVGARWQDADWSAQGRAALTLTGLDLATDRGATAALAELRTDLGFQATPEAQSVNGTVNTATLHARSVDHAVTLAALDWRGKLDADAGAIRSDAALTLSSLDAGLPDAQRVRVGEVRWQGRAARAADGTLDVDGRLGVDTAAADLAALDLDLKRTAWAGRVQGHPARTLNLAGALELAGLDARQTDRTVAADGLAWDGDTAIDFAADAAPRITATGTLNGTGIAAHAAPDLDAGLARIDARDLALAADAGGLRDIRADLTVQALRASQPPQSVRVAELDVPGLVHRVPNVLRSGHVVVTGLDAEIVRAATPKPAQGEPHAAKAATPKAAGGDAEAPGSNIQVAGLTLRQSQVHFRDEDITPHFTAAVQGLGVELGAFDSQKPDDPTEARIEAVLGEFGQLQIEGRMRPLQPTAFADLHSALLGFDMPELNPYLRASLGDEVESGQLDVNSEIRIEQGQLDVQNAIEVRKLVLRKAAGPEAASTEAGQNQSQGGGSLLNSAVSLLSDSDDTIRLKLPITGAVGDPQFDLSDAINKALGKSIATGVLLYFQPLGALVAVGKLATSQFSVLEFNPVAFPPGRDALDGAGKAYLADLAKRLADRPNIQVKVCAVATESDRAALTPQPEAKPAAAPRDGDKAAPPPPAVDNVALLQLAKARANAVTRQLSRELGIDAKRLVGCAARIATETDAVPEVRLGQ